MSITKEWLAFRDVFRFEWRLRLRSAATWICLAALALMLFRDVMAADWDKLSSSGRVARNSSYSGYMLLMFSTFWVSAMAAGFLTAPLLRDERLRLAGILQSTPVSDAAYFWGKYLAGMTGLLIVATGTALGWVLLPVAGPVFGAHPGEYGPTQWGQLAQAWLLFTVPEVLLHGTAHFLIAARLRSIVGSFAYVSLHMVLWVMFEVSFRGIDPPLVQMLDPIGKAALDGQMQYWSATERMGGWLSLEGPLLWNRVVHLGVAAVFLVFARWGFRWRGVFGRAGKAKSVAEEIAKTEPVRSRPAPAWNASRDWRRFSWMIGFREWRLCVRSPMFKAMFALGIIPSFFTALNLAGYGNADDGVTLPTFATAFVPGMQVFYFMMLLTVVFFAGEIASRERTLRVASLVDASPVPAGAWWAGKVLGVALLAGSIFCAPLCGYLAAQAASGWWAPEWGRLFTILMFNYLTPNVGMGCLAVFLHQVIPNRGIAHGASVLAALSIMVMHEIGVTESHLGQPFLPIEGLFRSAFAVHDTAIMKLAWFNAYWAGLALPLLALGAALAARGTEAGLRSTLLTWRSRLRPAPFAVLGCGAALMALTVNGIIDRMHVANDFRTRAEENERRAAYEHEYGAWRDASAPRWAGGHLTVELFPTQRRARFTGEIALVWPRDGRRTDRFLLNLPEHVALERLEIAGRPAEIEHRADLRVATVRTTVPESDTPVSARMVWSAAYTGFANHGWAGLVRPGTTLITPELLPVLGYDPEREIELRGTRSEHELGERAPRLRWPDALASRRDSIPGLWQIAVESDGSQEILAPGELLAEERADGRIRRKYRMLSAGPPPLYIIAAPYAAQDLSVTGARLRLFSHPQHGFNAVQWEKAANAALATLRSVLGDYGYTELRIAEVPHSYLDEPVACGNLLLIPENKGWLHDYRKPPALDWIGYITARELAIGWLAFHAPVKDTPGSVLLTEGLPATLALWVLEQSNPDGAKQYRLRLADRYLRSSNLEDGREPALVDSDDEEYLAHKAAYVLDATRRQLGDSAFGRLVAGIAQHREASVFVAQLEGSTVAENQGAVREWLRDVVVYDLRVGGAKARGTNEVWKVQTELGAQRFVATDQNNRAPAGIADRQFSLRVSGKETPLLDVPVRVTADGVWSATVPREPTTLHFDPAAFWLDRDRSNNRTSISAR